MTADKPVAARAENRQARARMATNKDYLAFHKVDPVSVPLGEKIFMAAATGLVLVGLPLALAAIFHFVLPLVGKGWVN